MFVIFNIQSHGVVPLLINVMITVTNSLLLCQNIIKIYFYFHVWPWVGGEDNITDINIHPKLKLLAIILNFRLYLNMLGFSFTNINLKDFYKYSICDFTSYIFLCSRHLYVRIKLFIELSKFGTWGSQMQHLWLLRLVLMNEKSRIFIQRNISTMF